MWPVGIWCQLDGGRATPDLRWLGTGQSLPGVVTWARTYCLTQSPTWVPAKDLLTPGLELRPGPPVCIEVTLETPGFCP